MGSFWALINLLPVLLSNAFERDKIDTLAGTWVQLLKLLLELDNDWLDDEPAEQQLDELDDDVELFGACCRPLAIRCSFKWRLRLPDWEKFSGQ